MEAIKSWVLNIAAVAVLMILLDLLMPEGRIRRFTQLLTGFILMFVMINPVLQLFGRGMTEAFAGWEDQAFLWNSQVEYAKENLGEEQGRQTMELYREMLLADISNRLVHYGKIQKAEVDVVLNENRNSKDFGKIKKLYIHLMLDPTLEDENGKPEEREKLLQDIHQELQKVFLLEDNEIKVYFSQEIGRH